jgi:hypothetical protein
MSYKILWGSALRPLCLRRAKKLQGQRPLCLDELQKDWGCAPYASNELQIPGAAPPMPEISYKTVGQRPLDVS